MSQQEMADARGIAECRGGQVGGYLGHAGLEGRADPVGDLRGIVTDGETAS
jgi:hypothetical protein